MKDILVLGAGRSSYVLINYLIENAGKNDWQITVGDVNLEAASKCVEKYAHARAFQFDVRDSAVAEKLISLGDVVISLLPPHHHLSVARWCLKYKKHLVTASYVSPEMEKLHQQALELGLIFINECGLDPGIDHMSVMKVVDHIKNQGYKIVSLESFTGGLIAPDTDPGNPWRYKFTWNPKNVVTAGQGVAKFLKKGKTRFIPYHRLFKDIREIEIPTVGTFEGYFNRDSLSYLKLYGLEEVSHMVRGTLRHQGFCEAWDVLVQLGCCNDSYPLDDLAKMSHADFLDLYLAGEAGLSVEEKLVNKLGLEEGGHVMNCLAWSGFFKKELIGISEGTPADALQQILSKRWTLKEKDKDMVVMWHHFAYEKNGAIKRTTSSLVCYGESRERTAMSKTVGLPLGIATKLLLQGKIEAKGVVIPTQASFYMPILAELEEYGVIFKEWES